MSFINHEEKMVILGAWNFNTDNDNPLIIYNNWEYKNNHRQPGYSQVIEHLKLLDQGYSLYIFHQENIGDDEDEPKIGKNSGNILKAHIKHDGEAWYAYRNAFDYLPDEIGEEEEYFEGLEI